MKQKHSRQDKQSNAFKWERKQDMPKTEVLSRVAARPVFVNDEVEKIKNADPHMINLGPGMSNFGAETFKLLRSNNLNQYAVQ